jgi:hypothetical protein
MRAKARAEVRAPVQEALAEGALGAVAFAFAFDLVAVARLAIAEVSTC